MKKFSLLPQSKYKCSGFSLLELSIVLLLIALLMLLSGIQTGFLQRMFVRSELEQLYTVCYYLQRSAMAKHKPQTITFDLQKQSYQYNNNTEHVLPQNVQFGCTPGAKGPPSSAHNAITNPITFQNNTITFQPNGIIEPGTVYITDSKKQHTYALSCAVAQVSYLRKYQYNGKWIQL